MEGEGHCEGKKGVKERHARSKQRGLRSWQVAASRGSRKKGGESVDEGGGETGRREVQRQEELFILLKMKKRVPISGGKRAWTDIRREYDDVVEYFTDSEAS